MKPLLSGILLLILLSSCGKAAPTNFVAFPDGGGLPNCCLNGACMYADPGTCPPGDESKFISNQDR